tara:strand:+ start:1195 stop:1380 length:186 start_codon:yes stop_codon:yes gene_type:complete
MKTKQVSKSRAEVRRHRKAEKVRADAMTPVDMGVKELAELSVGLRGVGSFIIEDDGVRGDS